MLTGHGVRYHGHCILHWNQSICFSMWDARRNQIPRFYFAYWLMIDWWSAFQRLWRKEQEVDHWFHSHNETSHLLSPSKLLVPLVSSTGHRSVLPECFDQWQEPLYVMGPPSAGWLRFPWQHKGTTHEAVVLWTQSTFNHHVIRCFSLMWMHCCLYRFICIEQVKTVILKILHRW